MCIVRQSNKLLAAAALSLLLPTAVGAYPQFQKYVEERSGKTVDCAMCHVNPHGPQGTGEGQIGSLTAADLERLSDARSAIEPGHDVDSPILNRFGNSIIKAIGKKKVLEAAKDPAQLATMLDEKSDIDADGISDAQEYLDGSDPNNKFHGDPARLLQANANRNMMHIFACIFGVLLLDWGFINMIRGFRAIASARAAARRNLDLTP